MVYNARMTILTMLVQLERLIEANREASALVALAVGIIGSFVYVGYLHITQEDRATKGEIE